MPLPRAGSSARSLGVVSHGAAPGPSLRHAPPPRHAVSLASRAASIHPRTPNPPPPPTPDDSRYSIIRTFFRRLARQPPASAPKHAGPSSPLHPRLQLIADRAASASLASFSRPFPLALGASRAFHSSGLVRADESPPRGKDDAVPSSSQQPPTGPAQGEPADANATEDAASSHTSKAPPSTPAHRSTSLFYNYPRTLRELALRAVGQGRAAPGAGEAARQAERGGVSHSAPPPSSGSPSSGGPGHSGQSHFTRPTKEDLLRLAEGFWTRLRIRFKWFTIRGFRRFNADDISAFFTLGGLGTILFVIIGTTTFVSLVFAALEALNMQEYIARRIADYLTSETGVTVIFESAIVPKWKESRICFQNVFISRRAYGNEPDELRRERKAKRAWHAARRRRRTATTPGEGMAWEGTHYADRDHDHDVEIEAIGADENGEGLAPPMSDRARGEDLDEDERPNSNFTMFDLNVDEIDVTLSFSRWWEGKGLIEDAVVKGVRGIVDRRNVFWDPQRPYDPKAARRKHRRGDFELESLVVEDFLVTVYQPSDFRPFNLSVFSAHIPRLRKQWLFYDLLNADSITGQVDGCLFSLHKPQSIGRTTKKERELKQGRWKSVSRVRVDGVNFDHIQNQSGLHGPVSWILSGRFDVVADMMFPQDRSGDIDINAVISEILDNLSHAVSGDPWDPEAARDAPIPGQHRLSGPAIEAPVTALGPAAREAWRVKERERAEAIAAEEERLAGPAKRFARRRQRRKEAALAAEREQERLAAEGAHEGGHNEDAASLETLKQSVPPPSVVIDLDVRFKDIKAAVPLFHSDLGYRTQTFVRPIVAFMNANHTLIPVHCRVVMDLSEFDGSMDLAQTGLLPVVSEKIYEALANHVSSQRANGQRLRSVSSWSLKLAASSALQLAVLVRDSVAGRLVRGGKSTDEHALVLGEAARRVGRRLERRAEEEDDGGEDGEEDEERDGDGEDHRDPAAAAKEESGKEKVV